MRKAILTAIGSAFLLLLAFSAASAFDLKPGLWEIATTTESTGAPPIPADFLAKLTPEQQAKFQAAMQARMNHPRQHTYQKCMTREEIDDPGALLKESDNCKPTILSKSSNSAKVKVICSGEMNSTILYDWHAPTPKTMDGTMNMT